MLTTILGTDSKHPKLRMLLCSSATLYKLDLRGSHIVTTKEERACLMLALLEKAFPSSFRQAWMDCWLCVLLLDLEQTATFSISSTRSGRGVRRVERDDRTHNRRGGESEHD
ncbi:hypothetical protein Tco_0585110 [Tanacetum coccineum]